MPRGLGGQLIGIDFAAPHKFVDNVLEHIVRAIAVGWGCCLLAAAEDDCSGLMCGENIRLEFSSAVRVVTERLRLAQAARAPGIIFSFLNFIYMWFVLGDVRFCHANPLDE